jgi:polyisoprenoid-binding protein YceI
LKIINIAELNQIIMTNKIRSAWKKILFLAASFTILSLTAFVKIGLHTDRYIVDTSKSTLEWYAEKVTGKHNGTIKLSGGEISNNHGKLSGFVEMDMTSIQNSDLTGDSKAKLEKHLHSADFFYTEKFPKSKFVIKSITPLQSKSESGMTHLITGMLTMRDSTSELKFEAGIKLEGNAIVCNGTAIVDRTKFNIRYGSKTFFPNIGDKMIYDEFKLKFNLVASTH